MTEAWTLHEVLTTACRAVGLDPAGASVVRLGENAIYRLPHGVIVRVARPGQQAAARREVAVSRWLRNAGAAAVYALDAVTQPVEIGDRAVTFWEELPPHEQGSPRQVGAALKALHALPVPDSVPLGDLDPFVRLEQRLAAAITVSANDRAWLGEHLAVLRKEWVSLARSFTTCVVHGDAWAGNVVALNSGDVVLLDLERCSVGPPEWDLVSTAVRHMTYGGISAADYADFVATYGRDVMAWEHFRLLRDLRELRMTCYVAQHAASNHRSQREAELRIQCLRGKCGPRPWPWTPAD